LNSEQNHVISSSSFEPLAVANRVICNYADERKNSLRLWKSGMERILFS